MMADNVYPEGVTAMDHVQHDIKIGRFPNQSSVKTFLAERKTLSAQEKVGHLPNNVDDRKNSVSAQVPAAVSEYLVFFASVIKSGEPWTADCEEMYAKARVAMA